MGGCLDQQLCRRCQRESFNVNGLSLNWDFETTDLPLFAHRVSACLKPFRFVEAANQPHTATLLQRRIGKLDIVFIRYGKHVIIDAGCLKRFALLQVPVCGHFILHQPNYTAVVNEGSAHLLPTGVPLRMEWSPDCTLMAVRFNVDPDDPIHAANPFTTADTPFGGIVDLSKPKGRSLSCIVDLIVNEIVLCHTLEAAPRIASYVGATLDELVRATFACRSMGDMPSLSRVGRYIRDRVDQNMAGELDWAAIADAVGISARSLYRIFTREFGTTPTRWLNNRRLEHAHRELEHKNRSQTSVTEVALKYGFGHVGRFSERYRERFGESPRDTLRRR